MVELKTLKNLLPDVMVSKCFGDSKGKTLLQRKDMMVGAYTLDCLKQEAINWIKELIKEKKLEFTIPDGRVISFETGDPEWETHAQLLLNWIKHFFNITEEELNGN